MYCKFCGNRIASNASKCVSCGASINLNDGGQSFFEDNEVDEWQTDSIMSGQHMSIPKTEMRKPIHDNDSDFKVKNYKKVSAKSQNSPGDRSVYYPASVQGGTNDGNYPSTAHRRTKKKTVFDYLNLSSSNKLIIFCIASALSIVLPVVAIIAVLDSEPTNKNKHNTEMYAIPPSTDEATRIQTTTELPGTNNNVSVLETSPNKKEEIKDVEIIISGKKVEHPVSAYMIDNRLYVSLGRILKNEGYKDGIKTNDGVNRVRYEHSKDNRCIEIETGTNTIWIRKSGEKEKSPYYMEQNSFVEGTEIYVPARSFLEKIGYSKIEYDDKNKRTLKANK